MRKNILPILIIAIAIIIVIVIVVVNQNKNSQDQGNNVAKNESAILEEFVTALSDGTKLNNSTKLSETKKVGDLEISNLQLTEKDSQTILLGTIKNPTTTAQGGFPATVTILDKNGNTIIELEAYIDEVKPGEEQQFNVSATLDYANAYDVKIEKMVI